MSRTGVEFCPWCGMRLVIVFSEHIIVDAVGAGYLCVGCGTSFMVQDITDDFPENKKKKFVRGARSCTGPSGPK